MIFARSNGWIGMDLGAARIKVAQIQKSGGAYRLVGSAIVPRRQPALAGVAAAASSESDGCTAAVVARQHGSLSGSQVACLLPICHTDLRTFRVPASSDAERQSLVRQELMDVLDDCDDRVYDHWLCPVTPLTGDGGAMQDVGVVSSPRSVVGRLTEDLAAARCRCEVIDGLPMAMARAVPLMDDGHRRGPVAAVHWGSDSGVFCIVTDGLPAYTRHLRNCGFVKLVDGLRTALNLTGAEAYEVLTQTGLPDPQVARHPQSDLQEVLAELTSQALREFADELRRTVSFLKTQYPDLVAQQMILMGDGAGMRNVELQLQRKLGLTVSPWQMPCAAGGPRQPHHQHPQVFAGAAALSALAFVS